MGRLIALLLVIAITLSACAPREAGPSLSSFPEAPAPSSDSPGPESTALGETPAFSDPEEAAKVLTGTILEHALLPGAGEGWQGEAETLDLLTFSIQAALVQEHPYREWFPVEEQEDFPLYCYPGRALDQMIWEIFGIRDWEPEQPAPLEWNEEKDRYQSILQYGLRWPAFRADGEMTTAWGDDSTLTVSVPLSRAANVNGDPGFLPLGKSVFTYRQMKEEGRTFLRLTSLEVEKAQTLRYNTVPGITIPRGPVEKIVYQDQYVGNEISVSEPDTIAAVLDLLEEIVVYELPDEPVEVTRPFGFTCYRFYAAPEDEVPSFTVYLNPFCVEAGGKRSGCYLIDETHSTPASSYAVSKQMYTEMNAAILKYPQEGKTLVQFPFRGGDGTLRTVSFFFPEDWTVDGATLTGPDGEQVTITAYYTNSPPWSTPEDPRWIAGRTYWEEAQDNGWHYFFTEGGCGYQITFSPGKTDDPGRQSFEDMLWDLVYIQNRGPDQMAGAVAAEQPICEP